MKLLRTATARLLISGALTAGLALSDVGSVSATTLTNNIEVFAAEAKARDKNFKSFSANRGQILFSSRPATGKPDTPSCTSCHTANPKGVGQTRAGKEIAPMALSSSPNRYTDPKKIEKWFRRNCKSVLGRVCTAMEKGDFLTFMISQ